MYSRAVAHRLRIRFVLVIFICIALLPLADLSTLILSRAQTLPILQTRAVRQAGCSPVPDSPKTPRVLRHRLAAWSDYVERGMVGRSTPEVVHHDVDTGQHVSGL